jgi:hypothetical protein|tara:strand:- start:161 stop:493 length:333 start_codon:yes stop_codon:yes gene_type:complete
MFFKNKYKQKEDTMKNVNEKAVMTAAEKLGEALVLKPDWEVKPKSVVMTHIFSVEFNESTKEIQLSVNGDIYKTVKVQDVMGGKIKFHEGLNAIVSKFNLWRFDEPKTKN